MANDPNRNPYSGASERRQLAAGRVRGAWGPGGDAAGPFVFGGREAPPVVTGLRRWHL